MNSSGRPKADAQLTALVRPMPADPPVVRRVSGSRAPLIQDDVQQNVMLALWQQLERGQTIERPASYIFRAAIREAVRLIRRDHAQMSAALEDDADWRKRPPVPIPIGSSKTKSVNTP